MKKFLFILIMCIAALTACKQNTIKFLDIPVDGTKQEMMDQLQAKGFKYDSVNDCLMGEFNGMESGILLTTFNNKVWRVIVMNKTPLNSFNADVRFNNFVDQFTNNEKYIRLSDEEISENYTLSFWNDCQDVLYFNKCAVFAFKNGITKEGINEGVAIYSFHNNVVGGYGIMILYNNHNNVANGEDL